MIRESATSSPLYWPPGWPRTISRERSGFRPTTVHRQIQELLAELARMRVPDWNVIISTNLTLKRDGLPYSGQKTPSDPGVAVWFTLDGEERVLACDRWDLVEHNLRAIAKHINALRGQERWCVGSLEQSFRGYTALPEGNVSREWWDVLEVRRDATEGVIRANYKRLALDRHPDQGGTREEWDDLQHAYEIAMKQLKGAHNGSN